MEDIIVNPLLNPLILKQIYKLLDFGNKKTFRLVCKSWIDAILGDWRIQTKLVIKNEPEFSNLMKLFNRRTNPGFYKILEYPITHLYLGPISFANLPTKNSFEKSQKFIVKHFGLFLENLEISGCRFLPEGRIELGLKQILLRDFPKLKSFSIKQSFVNSNPNWDHVLEDSFDKTVAENLTTLNLDVGTGIWIGTKACLNILNILPNLQKLQLRGKVCKILESLKLPLASTGRHILVEHLVVNHTRYPNNLEKIPNWLTNYFDAAQPLLKTLKISIPGEVSPAFLLQGILTNVSSTLTCLDLRVTSMCGGWFKVFSGCFLPKLNKLLVRFQDLSEYGNDLIKFDFGMLRGTPLLKVLHLEIELMPGSNICKIGAKLKENELEWRSEEEENPREAFRLENLEDFRFELYHKPSENCWRAIASIMPNLRKLQAILDEQTFPLVLQLWPELKHCLLSSRCPEEARIRQEVISEMQMERGEATKIEFGGFCDWNEWDKW